MSAKANKDVSHPLYLEQIKRILQLTKTHDLKSSDLDLCVHWFEAFSTCGEEEKLARKSLADILYRQLNYKGYLSSPFTDVENCQRNLNELLREYGEQRGRQRLRSEEEQSVRLNTPQPSAPPPSCINLAASRASGEDVTSTRQSSRQENRYPAGQTSDIQNGTTDKTKKVAEVEWKAQFRTVPSKESEGRNTLPDKHTPGWLEQKKRTTSPGRAERDQADLDEKLLQIYEREQKNRILAEKRDAERKRKQEERKRLQQIEKDLLEAKKREMEKQRQYQEERVRLQREWERNSVQKRAQMFKKREHSPRKAEEQIKISPKHSPRERNEVRWIEKETSTQRVSKPAINESKEEEQKQKEELQTIAEPENRVHRSIDRLDALRRKMARTINEESASEEKEEKRKMEQRKKIRNLGLETNIEIERSAMIIARLEIEKKEHQRKQQAEEREAYQKMYEKRTRQRQEEKFQEILKREQEKTRQIQEELQQRLRQQESKTKLVDEKYKELRQVVELHKRREEQRSQERLQREQEKARVIEMDLQLRLRQQESKTKLVADKCLEFEQELELYKRQKEQGARKREKQRSEYDMENRKYKAESSDMSERAPGGRHCSDLQPDLAQSQPLTRHELAQESSDAGMQGKKSNRSVRFNMTPMFSDGVDTKMSMYSQSRKDNAAKVSDPYVAEHVQAAAEDERKQADWKYADSIKERLLEKLNKQRTDNRIVIQKMQTFEEEELEEALETNSRSSKKRKDIENCLMEYMQHNTQQQHLGAKQDNANVGYHEQSCEAKQPNESSSSCENDKDSKLTLVGKYYPIQNVYIMQELGSSKRRRLKASAAKVSSSRPQAGGMEATKNAYDERDQYNAHVHQYIAELENKLQLCQRVSCPVEQSTQTMSCDEEFLSVVDKLMELKDYQNNLPQRHHSEQQRTEIRKTAACAARNYEDSFEHYHAQVRHCLAQLESKLQLRHEVKNKPEQSVSSSSNDEDFQRSIEQLKELYDYRKNWLRRRQLTEQLIRESAGQAESANNVGQQCLMEKALHQDLSAAEQQLLFERIYQSLPADCSDHIQAIKYLDSQKALFDNEPNIQHYLKSCADSAVTKQSLDTFKSDLDEVQSDVSDFSSLGDAAGDDAISQTTSYWSTECICAPRKRACAGMGGCVQPLHAQPELPAAGLPCRVFGSLIEPLVRICGGEFPQNNDAQLRVEIEGLDQQLEKHLHEPFKRKFVESYKDKLLERATRLQRQLRHEENVLRASTCYNLFLSENKNQKSISQCCFELLREMLEEHNDLEGNLSMRLLMQKIEQLFMKLTNV